MGGALVSSLNEGRRLIGASLRGKTEEATQPALGLPPSQDMVHPSFPGDWCLASRFNGMAHILILDLSSVESPAHCFFSNFP